VSPQQPVHFFLPAEYAPPAEALAGVDGQGDRYFLSTHWAWIVQTYLRLRERGRNVELTSRLPEAGVIVHCSGHLPDTYLPTPRQFLVGVLSDGPPSTFAQINVSQNRIQSRLLPDTHYVPHWPQPGLVARDPGRGAAFSSVAYYGDEANLAAELGDPRWPSFLASRHLHWHVRGAASPAKIDFSDVDCAVAVRSFRRAGYIRKPASKLFNAWIAGVPALLGREFAFREQRRSALDYIEIGSYDEACAAIDRLAAAPALRQQMIDNGRQRAAEVSVERIAGEWQRLLDLAEELARRWAALGAAGRRGFVLRRQLQRKIRGAAFRVLRAIDREQYAL
jgi:hypothetical protein